MDKYELDGKMLGKRINIARKSRGLTSEKLAEMCNINATFLRQIEGGSKGPSPVSYTHLDVYERQVLLGPPCHHAAGESMPPGRPLPRPVCFRPL